MSARAACCSAQPCVYCALAGFMLFHPGLYCVVRGIGVKEPLRVSLLSDFIPNSGPHGTRASRIAAIGPLAEALHRARAHRQTRLSAPGSAARGSPPRALVHALSPLPDPVCTLGPVTSPPLRAAGVCGRWTGERCRAVWSCPECRARKENRLPLFIFIGGASRSGPRSLESLHSVDLLTFT